MAGPASKSSLTLLHSFAQQQQSTVDSQQFSTTCSAGATATPCTSPASSVAIAVPGPFHAVGAVVDPASLFTSSSSSPSSCALASSPASAALLRTHILAFPPHPSTPALTPHTFTATAQLHHVSNSVPAIDSVPIPISSQHQHPAATLPAHSSIDPASLSPAVFSTPSLAAVAVDVPDWARLSPASLTPSSLSPAAPGAVTLHVVDQLPQNQHLRQNRQQHVPAPVVEDDSLEALFSSPASDPASGRQSVHAALHDRDPPRFVGNLKTIRAVDSSSNRVRRERNTATSTAPGRGLQQKRDRIQDRDARAPTVTLAPKPMASYSHSAWLAAVSTSKGMPSPLGSSGGGRQGPASSNSPLQAMQTDTAAVDSASREHDVDQCSSKQLRFQHQHQHQRPSILFTQQQQQQQHESVQHAPSSILLARRPSLPSIQSILSEKSTTPSPPLHLGVSIPASCTTPQDVSLHHHQAQSQSQQVANAASHLADRRGSLLSLIEATSSLSPPSPPTNVATLPARAVWSPPPPSGMSMLHPSTTSAAVDDQAPPAKRLRTMSYPSAVSAASALAGLPLASSAGRPLPPPYVTGVGPVVVPFPPPGGGGAERRGSTDQQPLPPPPPPPPARSVASGSRGQSIDFGTLFSSAQSHHPIPQAQPLPPHDQPPQHHPHNPSFSHHAAYPPSQPTTIPHLTSTLPSTSKPKKRAATGSANSTRRDSASTRRPSKSLATDSLPSIPSLSINPNTALGVPLPRVRGGRGRGRSGADEPSLPHPKAFFAAVLKSKDPPPSSSSSSSSSLVHASSATQSMITSPKPPLTSVPAAVVPPIDQQYQAHLASVLPGSPPPGASASQQQQVTQLGPMVGSDATDFRNGRGDSLGAGSAAGQSVEESFPILTSGVTIHFAAGQHERQVVRSPPPVAMPSSGPRPTSSVLARQDIGNSTCDALGRRPSVLRIDTSVPASSAGYLPSPFTTAPLHPPSTQASNPTSPIDADAPGDHHHQQRLSQAQSQTQSLHSTQSELASTTRSQGRTRQEHDFALSPTSPTPSRAMFHVTSSLTVIHVACDPMPHDFASTPVLYSFSLETLQSQLAGRPISDLIHPADAYPILGLPTLRNMYMQQQQQQQQGPQGPPATWSWTLRVCDGTQGYLPAKVEVSLTEAGRHASAGTGTRKNEAVWLVTIVPEAQLTAAPPGPAPAPALVVNGIVPFPSPVGGASAAAAAEANQFSAMGTGKVGGGAAGGVRVGGQQYLV